MLDQQRNARNVLEASAAVGDNTSADKGRATRWPRPVVAVESVSTALLYDSHELLLAAGLELHLYADGAATLLGLMAEDPVAVLAPTDLSGVDFPTFVRAVVSWSDIPVIIGLAGSADAAELGFAGLEAGARGLVSLPCRAEELIATLGRAGFVAQPKPPMVRQGPLLIDHVAHRVTAAGQSVQLTVAEIRVLSVLADHAPGVMSISEIAAALGDESSELPPDRIRTQVHRIREKFAALGFRPPQPIESVRKVGYRLFFDGTRNDDLPG